MNLFEPRATIKSGWRQSFVIALSCSPHARSTATVGGTSPAEELPSSYLAPSKARPPARVAPNTVVVDHTRAGSLR